MKTLQTIMFACLLFCTVTITFTGCSKDSASLSNETNIKSSTEENAVADKAPGCTLPSAPTLQASPVVCRDIPEDCTASASGATSYSWTVKGGTIISYNLNKSQVRIRWSSLAKSVSVKAVNSCGSSASSTVNVTRVIPKCL